MPEMIPNDVDPAWTISFDWVHAEPDVHDSAWLSVALSAFVRQCSRPQLQPTEETIRFGRYIRAMREARRWSRTELAERANLHPFAVALLESASLTEAEFSPALVSRIAMAFGKSVRDLDLNPLAIMPLPDAQPFGSSLARHLDRLAGYEQGRMPASPRAVAEEPATYQAGMDLQRSHRIPGPHAQLMHTLQLPSQRIALPSGDAARARVFLEPAATEGGSPAPDLGPGRGGYTASRNPVGSGSGWPSLPDLPAYR